MVLGVRRCEPLWQAAGVPQPIRELPAAALGAAREFLLATVGDQDAIDFEAALARSFERLEDAYGADGALAVEAWGRRHFVRASPHGALEAWSAFFLAVVRASRLSRLASSLRMAPERKARALAALETQYSAPIDRLGRVIAQAEAIPLSELEGRLIAYDPAVLSPGDDPHFPVVASAANAAHAEIARRMWLNLSALLEPQEQFAFVSWARELAPSMRIDPNFLSVPDET